MSVEAPRRAARLPRASRLVLVVPAAGMAAVAGAVFAVRGGTQPAVALAFFGLVTFGEVLRVRAPGDREFAPVATSGALAYACLLGMGGEPATHDGFQVIVVTAAGLLAGAAPHMAAGLPPRFTDMARRLLVVAAIGLLFRPFASSLYPVDSGSCVSVVALLGALGVAGAIEVLVASAARYVMGGMRFRTAFRDESRMRTPLGIAIGGTALLIVLAASVMGWSALGVCIIPLIVTQVAYRRYAGIRATYRQTIRALSRVTEVGGYVRSGHSRRVSHLAVRIGQELDLDEAKLLNLEYAALMHDIGQLSLPRPAPAGATVHLDEAEQRRIAELGAEVVRQTGVLDCVAEIIAGQAEPYRAPRDSETEFVPQSPSPRTSRSVPQAGGQQRQQERGAGTTASTDASNQVRPVEGPSLESRIVRVANALDDLGGETASAADVRAALRTIGRGEGETYDPAVVRALRRVLDRNPYPYEQVRERW